MNNKTRNMEIETINNSKICRINKLIDKHGGAGVYFIPNYA
jgi:hypothetical protein